MTELKYFKTFYFIFSTLVLQGLSGCLIIIIVCKYSNMGLFCQAKAKVCFVHDFFCCPLTYYKLGDRNGVHPNVFSYFSCK